MQPMSASPGEGVQPWEHLSGWQLMPSPLAALANGLFAGPELAGHCAAAMLSLLDGSKWLCANSEPQWTAPAFLWDRILRMLPRYDSGDPGHGPHPSTAEWVQGAGEDIPESTRAQETAVVQQRDAAARRNPRAVRTVLLGNRPPSPLENAVGSTAGDPAWREKLTTALTVLNSRYEWNRGLLASPGDNE
jgi:hypothetical protein